MNSIVRPFRPELERMTDAAREEQARVVFDGAAVKSLLSRAASEGRTVCVISATLDLSGTEAARSLIAWCDKEGLKAAWAKGQATEQHAETPNNLVVSWTRPTR